MSKKSWVDRDHYRTVSGDRQTSYLYKTDGWQSHCVEVADHRKDKTTAHKADTSPVGTIFYGGKGARK